MINLNEEIDRVLNETLDEGFFSPRAKAKHWLGTGSSSTGLPPSGIPSDPTDDPEDPDEEDPDEEDSSPEEEEGEPEPEPDFDCSKIINIDDPEIRKLLDKVEASQTIRAKLALLFRDFSFAVDVTTISTAGALAVTGVGALASPIILKGGGQVSGTSQAIAAVFSLLNGDFKMAMVDTAAAGLSIALAGGGAVSKTVVKGAGSAALRRTGAMGAKAAAADAGKVAAKGGGAAVVKAATKQAAVKAAKLERMMVSAVTAVGFSEELATVVVKSGFDQTKQYVQTRLKQLIGEAPVQREDEPDEKYRKRLQIWQKLHAEKLKGIYEKCLKRGKEESALTKKVKKSIDWLDFYVGFLTRKFEKLIDVVVGFFTRSRGAPTEESIQHLREELELLMNEDRKLLKEDKLATIAIDFNELRKQELNESFLAMFGGWVEHILGAMFGGRSIPVSVSGSQRDVESFARALGGERSYMEAVKRYGLDHPTTYRNMAKLENSIKGFEKETGLKWPFK